MPDTVPQAGASFYESVGGHETFVKLIDVFYEQVGADPDLRPLYPEPELDGAKHRLLTFLEQYWGGPTTYSEERGHPRLRMRHVPYAVTPQARDRWLAHMRTALDAVELPPLYDATFWDYLTRAAHAMINAPDERSGPGLPISTV